VGKINLFGRLRTIRYLKPSQLHYYLIRRGLPTRSIQFSENIITRSNSKLVAPIQASGVYVSDYAFEFLNVTAELGVPEINWQPDNMSRLWQYNLHYFDYLREPERSRENKKSLVDSWIKLNQQGSQPGWEPFTVSLRIVNWIFFFLVEMENEEIPQFWLKSLYEQALWLEKNDEKHILANHYFENIKALMFAGVYFEGKTADKWLKKSQKLLEQQIQEQFLNDGGHYEKSPMYHCLMVENCLDLYNLAANNRGICATKLQALLKSQIEYSLHWLSDLQYHNGEMPLFNDAAHGIAPDYLQLSQYASRLFLYEPEASIVSGGRLIDLDATGYYGLEVNSDKFIIDCGDISPSYQPGHTHCDFLSYELVFDDQPVVVDSGVYEYAEGEMREYVRSTKAHNTVSVDEDEQSEIWAAFRVARRATKLKANIKQSNNGAVFSGGYEGFYAVKGRAKHFRKANISLNKINNAIMCLSIEDEIHMSGHHQVESFIHLHPSIDCQDQGSGDIQLVQYGEPIANVMIEEDCKYTISRSYYCPEFGKKIENSVIVLQKESCDNITMRYEINKV